MRTLFRILGSVIVGIILLALMLLALMYFLFNNLADDDRSNWLVGCTNYPKYSEDVGGNEIPYSLHGADLERLSQYSSTIKVRKTDYPTFTGAFGDIFAKYTVPAEKFSEEVSYWNKRIASEAAGSVDVRALDSCQRPPDWWFYPYQVRPMGNVIGKNIIGRMSPASISVWVEDSTQSFYLFFSWGH